MKELFNDEERRLGQKISELSYCNPFLPERINFEREILGKDFLKTEATWNIRANNKDERPNIPIIIKRAEELIEKLRNRLLQGANASEKDLTIYEDMALFILYHRFNVKFQEIITVTKDQERAIEAGTFYKEFLIKAKYFLHIRGVKFPSQHDIPHLFSIFFQIKRAFHHIFSFIVGGSMASAKLRAAVWQSIFTHNLKRYERQLYKIMGDITTLITGPSGTGKELVARAVGMSRYIPFDEKPGCFKEDFTRTFYPLNISALTPTLVESELFGHKKGAFTGALQDRTGWLEACSPLGTVFLDEIGEINPLIQVKLLRVIQDRNFQRIGDTKNRLFQGKIIAATNRNLSEEMERGTFRRDFYYRLCSDTIITPSLSEQLRESPEELHNLVLFIARGRVGEEAEKLSQEVVNWIGGNLGREYSWPGNIRELEQCIRNIMIRNEYHPPEVQDKGARQVLGGEIMSGSLTAEEVLERYCTLVYSQTGSYQATAKKIGLDRRTVKAKIDNDLLEKLKGC
ncbi:MAG: sigma-54-dependent Fis family transcriptional regulator [Proteobacteria bacterium]|nr:sigma-54-dependent Fis family transcriptional regulator [Pseudomonadota bacterium]